MAGNKDMIRPNSLAADDEARARFGRVVSRRLAFQKIEWLIADVDNILKSL